MEKIYRFFVRISCLFILNRKLRHKVSDYFLNSNFFTSLYSFVRFCFHKKKFNGILIVELNNCHTECVIAYTKLFQKLGYCIDIIITRKALSNKPFTKQEKKLLNIYTFSLATFSWIKNIINKKNYKCILLTSDTGYFTNNVNIIEKYPFLNKMNNFYVVCHDLKDIIRNNLEYLNKKHHLIMLGKFNKGVFINPNIFTDNYTHKKNDVTKFVVVGAIQAYRKNHNLLIEAIKTLKDKNLNFYVDVIGKGSLKNLPSDISDYIRFHGYLNFPKMFNIVKNSDFFLPLLDQNNPDHNRYITTGVTGSAQMIYGFRKIPLIQQKFSSFYKFDKENALFYNENLSIVMEEAIKMTQQEYLKYYNNLNRTVLDINKESMENLRRILHV